MTTDSPRDEKIDLAPREVEHTDAIDAQLDALKAGHDVQLKSSLDYLTIGQAFSTFRISALVCFAAALSAATDGYQSTLTSSLVSNKGFIMQFGELAADGSYALWPTAVSTFGGMFSAGMVIGQFSIQFFSDWLGRKAAMYTFMTLITLAAIVECVSTRWWHYTIAKTIAGIGIGSVQATLPVYINEQAPSQIRGFLIVAYSLWYSVGNLMSSVALSVMNTNSPYDWKTPVYTQFAMIGLAIIIYIFLPESPWWLVSKGRVEKARAVLMMKNKGVQGYDIDRELNIIVLTIEQQNLLDRESKAEGPFALFKGLNGKRFLIGCWPKVLQQFVGLGVFSSYSTYFFQLAGNTNPFNVTLIISAVGLLSTILDATLVDRIGRRRMTLIGFTGACFGVTLMAIVGCFDYKSPQLGGVLVFAGVFANFCNTFQSSTSYAYLTEMPEQRFRARATGWGLAYCNLFAVLFNFTIPLMLAQWVVKTAFLFVGLGIPGTILAYFIMPESMRRSPAEIQEMFVDQVPLRKWRGYRTKVENDLDQRMGQLVQ